MQFNMVSEQEILGSNPDQRKIKKKYIAAPQNTSQ
jgi:hypothetical protein